MLYCPRCDIQVDFNSTSASRVTGAYTMDLEGPIDPTIVRSESKVVNVCKNCGCTDLAKTKKIYSYQRAAKQRAIDAEDRFAGILAVVCLVLGVITTIFTAVNGMEGLEPLGAGAIVAVFVFIFGFVFRALVE